MTGTVAGRSSWAVWQVLALGLVLGVAAWLLWRWPGNRPEHQALQIRVTQQVLDLLQARSEVYWARVDRIDLNWWEGRRAAGFALGTEALAELASVGSLADAEAWPPEDMWGRAIVHEPLGDAARFRSAGPDGELGTADDLVSAPSEVVLERQRAIDAE